MMKNFFLACVAFIACTPASKVTSTKINDSTSHAMANSTGEAYPTIYKNIGYVSSDTTVKKP